MRKMTCLILGLSFMLAARGFVCADEASDMKALIETGVKSLGGKEKISKMAAISTKQKGKFYGMGEGIDYTSESWMVGPNKIRSDIQAEMNGNKFTFTQIYNNGKAWMATGGDANEMPEDAVAELKQSAYATNLARLYMLEEKEYTLKSLGDSKVGEKEALGIQVSRKGYRDVSLFLDKKTGLVLKVELAIKDVMGGGGDQKEERLYEGFKDIDGIQYATKITINHDGKKYVEAEATEVKFSEKLDDKIFEKPGT